MFEDGAKHFVYPVCSHFNIPSFKFSVCRWWRIFFIDLVCISWWYSILHVLRRLMFFRWWQNFLIILVIYSAWISPFELAFMRDLPTNFSRVDYCVDAFFFADIIVTFFVAYLDRSTYVLVDEKPKIALRYFHISVWDYILLHASMLCIL